MHIFVFTIRNAVYVKCMHINVKTVVAAILKVYIFYIQLYFIKTICMHIIWFYTAKQYKLIDTHCIAFTAVDANTVAEYVIVIIHVFGGLSCSDG